MNRSVNLKETRFKKGVSQSNAGKGNKQSPRAKGLKLDPNPMASCPFGHRGERAHQTATLAATQSPPTLAPSDALLLVNIVEAASLKSEGRGGFDLTKEQLVMADVYHPTHSPKEHSDVYLVRLFKLQRSRFLLLLPFLPCQRELSASS
jgi:hypothetical protein